MKIFIYTILFLVSYNVYTQTDTTQTNNEKDSIRDYRIEYMKNYIEEEKNETPYRKLRKPEYRQSNNVIYGTVGTAIFSVFGGIRYERKIIENFYARIGFERLNLMPILSPNRKYSITNVGGIALIGGNEKFLEIGVGISIMAIDKHIDAFNSTFLQQPAYGNETLPNFNLGYRLQKFKGVIFRVGVGRPDGLYLSLGTSF
jgi:hypothetical protein